MSTVIESDERVSTAAATFKRLMDDRGLSYRELGEKTGLPYSTIRNFLLGINEPSATVMLRLADAFGIPVKSPAFDASQRSRKGA